MQYFRSNDVDIAYEVTGEGDPIVLIHGFASNSATNWGFTGWVRLLSDLGRQVICIDNRGHGHSGKPYDPAKYEATEMAEDARRLLDHLGIAQADFMGYSMGARIATFVAIRHPGRTKSVVAGGIASNIFGGVSGGDVIADGLEAASLDDVTHPTARAFRMFAQHTRSDLRALAACMRAGRPAITRQALATISCPYLIVVGSEDDIAGPVDPLAAAVPGARAVVLPGRDHMKAVGDKGYKAAVRAFLGL